LPKGTYFIGLTSHPKANNTDVRGLLLLPKARRYGGLIGGDAPVTSVFIGRIGYWKQMVYKSTTKTGTGLSFQKDIYSGKKPDSSIRLPYVDTLKQLSGVFNNSTINN